MIPIFFWILLVLYIIGAFAPQAAPHRARIDTVFTIALFILLGLAVFRNPFAG
jgi:hypothetical protein